MTRNGITRRIDELGRIVVPKEIRYNLGIRDGDALEIYTEDNAIVIKKYSQVENIQVLSQSICDIIGDACDIDILVSDREKIIASSAKLNSLIGRSINDKYKKLIDNRETYVSDNKEECFDLNNYLVIVPIITSIDSCGLVFIIDASKNDVDLKYAKIIQKLIVNKIDIA